MSTFYLPVATPEMRAMAQKLSAGRQAKGKAAYTIIECTDSGAGKVLRRQFGSGLLAGVAADEKLYILLHGLINNLQEKKPVGTIGARRGAVRVAAPNGGTVWQGGVLRFYTPQSLAEHLEAEELNYQFVDLRMFCCFSGIMSAQLPNNASFASALRDDMRQLGYNNIQVTGYLGALADGYGHAEFSSANHMMAAKGITEHPLMPFKTASVHKTIEGPAGPLVASLNKVVFR